MILGLNTFRSALAVSAIAAALAGCTGTGATLDENTHAASVRIPSTVAVNLSTHFYRSALHFRADNPTVKLLGEFQDADGNHALFAFSDQSLQGKQVVLVANPACPVTGPCPELPARPGNVWVAIISVLPPPVSP